MDCGWKGKPTRHRALLFGWTYDILNEIACNGRAFEDDRTTALVLLVCNQRQNRGDSPTASQLRDTGRRCARLAPAHCYAVESVRIVARELENMFDDSG